MSVVPTSQHRTFDNLLVFLECLSAAEVVGEEEMEKRRQEGYLYPSESPMAPSLLMDPTKLPRPSCVSPRIPFLSSNQFPPPTRRCVRYRSKLGDCSILEGRLFDHLDAGFPF
jgi:hypothetical protein